MPVPLVPLHPKGSLYYVLPALFPSPPRTHLFTVRAQSMFYEIIIKGNNNYTNKFDKPSVEKQGEVEAGTCSRHLLSFTWISQAWARVMIGRRS